jgi:hypothetical protein
MFRFLKVNLDEPDMPDELDEKVRRVMCDLCHGSGEVICSSCDGSGVVRVEVKDAYNDWYPNEGFPDWE